MSPCDEVSLKALRYLDDRLQGQELRDFRAHLEVCPNCRASVETERALSRLLHRSRPLYSAPPALRARVAVAVEKHSGPILARENFYKRLLRSVGNGFADPVRRVVRLRLLAATLAVTAMLLAFVPSAVRQLRAADYVETAILLSESGRILLNRCHHGSRARSRFSFDCRSPHPAAYLPTSSQAQAW